MSFPDAEPEGSDLILRGRIEDSSVPELLRSVLGSGETGVLTFRNGDVTKSVYLHQGRVVYAKSTNPDERMGESLLLRGKITVRQYLEASQLIRPGRRLGAVLVDMGALEPEDLLPAVEQHVKEILLDVFAWSHGEYELVMSEPGLEDVVTLSFSMESLILEGIRRTRAWSRIYRGIGDIDSAPVPTGNTEVLLKLELTDEEQEILTHVTGRATVEQICQVSYLSNLETCRTLWAFHVLGVIRRGGPEEAATAQAGVLTREREMGGGGGEAQPDVQPDVRFPARTERDGRGRPPGQGPAAGLRPLRDALLRAGLEAARPGRLRSIVDQPGRSPRRGERGYLPGSVSS
jgi:hypothetical protein